MAFEKGQSGNPAGRPLNRIDKRTQFRELFESRAPELIDKAIELAMSGDIQALKLCIERIAPKLSGQHINLNTPPDGLENPNFLLSIGVEAIKNMISGNITPQQAKDLTAVLEVQRKMTETVELRPIFEEIKEHMKNRGY